MPQDAGRRATEGGGRGGAHHGARAGRHRHAALRPHRGQGARDPGSSAQFAARRMRACITRESSQLLHARNVLTAYSQRSHRQSAMLVMLPWPAVRARSGTCHHPVPVSRCIVRQAAHSRCAPLQGIDFYEHFHVLVLGLDSVEARRYMNSVACSFLGVRHSSTAKLAHLPPCMVPAQQIEGRFGGTPTVRPAIIIRIRMRPVLLPWSHRPCRGLVVTQQASNAGRSAAERRQCVAQSTTMKESRTRRR